MSSRRQSLWERLNDAYQHSLSSTATPFHATATPRGRPKQHTKYLKVINRNAKCDVCGQHRTKSMQQCSLCAHQTCLQCHMTRKYDEQHILDGLGLDWSFTGKGRRLQNSGVASASVEQNAETKVSLGGWNLRGKAILGHPSRHNQSTLGMVPGKQTHETQNTSSQAPFHLAHQRKVQFRDTNVVDEASLEAKRSCSCDQLPTSTLICGVKWNYEAFPKADKDLFTRVLVEGGQNTIKLGRIRISDNDPSLLLYDAATSKALLKQDQWAIEDPNGFELHWSFVDKLIEEWHGGENIQTEKLEAGDLNALDMLEVAFSFRAMSYDVPQGSFWVFWVAGMRQALQ